MPWDTDNYPVSMKNLPAKMRAKAIQIANALLDDGMEEGRAIRIAITQAKTWAAPHGRAPSGVAAEHAVY